LNKDEWFVDGSSQHAFTFGFPLPSDLPKIGGAIVYSLGKTLRAAFATCNKSESGTSRNRKRGFLFRGRTATDSRASHVQIADTARHA
jgi:hypothetical protein